jgi:hypothetical protein
VCVMDMTRHDALPCKPAVTGMDEMVSEAVTWVVRNLFSMSVCKLQLSSLSVAHQHSCHFVGRL